MRVTAAWVEEVRRALPELPAQKRRRFVAVHGLPQYDAGVLTQSPAVAEYFETVARESGSAKAASNWVMNDVLRTLKDGPAGPASFPVPPAALAELIRLVEGGTISGTVARDVFQKMGASGERAAAIVEREGLAQVTDEAAIRAAVAEVIAASPDQAAAYRGGKAAALGWFVGQVMRRMGGTASPRVVNDLVRKALDEAH
jgi:aspartyl-tRNA(Asn)/glutamyl-tRNA(Gln) amidotransferase subunit B